MVTATKDSQLQAVVAMTVERAQLIIAEYRDNQAWLEHNARVVAQVNSRQEQLQDAYRTYAAAAPGYGFDLETEMQRAAETADQKANEALAIEQFGLKPQSVRDMVSKILLDAHPGTLRAADIRARLAELGFETLHEKTVGMTLYRLSQDGIVERKGLDWSFVPLEKRQERQKQTEEMLAAFIAAVPNEGEADVG